METKKRLIVVLGMHRSGTSAIARGLQVLGVNLGDTLYGPMKGVNEKGFWEDIHLNSLDVEILDALGSNWHHVSPITKEDLEVLRSKGYFLRAVELLRQKISDTQLFGIKDPRVAKLLPFWKEVFDYCQIDVSYVLAVRNPLSVVKSLLNRDGFDTRKSYLLWLDHVIASLAGSVGSQRVLVDYDHLMQTPEHELGRIAAGLHLTIDPAELHNYRTEFLDKNLQHTVYHSKDLLLESACPPLVREIYAALLEVASDRAQLDDTGSAKNMERWTSEWERTSVALSLADSLYSQKITAVQAIAERDGQIVGLQQALVERDGQIVGLHQALAEREGQIVDLNQALAERDGQIVDLNQALAERDGQIVGLNQGLAERDGQIVDLNQALAERDRQIVGLSQGLAERDGQIVGLNQALEDRDGQIAGLDQTVAHRDVQIASLYASIEEIRSSTSWRVTAPLRFVVSTIRKLRSVFSVLPQILQKGGGLWSTANKAVNVYRKEGFLGVKARIVYMLRQKAHAGASGVQTLSSQASQFHPSPKLSIVPYYIDPRLDSTAVANNPSATIAVHLHLYYTEMLKEFVAYLNNIPVQYDLYVSVQQTSDAKAIQSELEKLLTRVKVVIVEPVPNLGRDIAPMIIQFGERLSKYEIIAHFHTKKSPHKSGLADWCQDILTKLMGKPESSGGRVAHIIELLQTTAKIVYPEGQTQIIKDRSGWADNHELAKQLLEKHTQFSIHDFPTVEFPEGFMFWARAECLKDFLGLPLNYNDFPAEPIAADGTLAHALERLILIFASQHDGQCIRIHKEDSIRDYRHYEDQHDYSMDITHSDIKVLSYYLPQFHPIPENDLWHGKGFTEWTKVSAANPLFEGHYQQHIPHSDIGYYLLDSPDTLRLQAEQMKKAGVHGQVFYHYWFTGKLILEEPAQLLLNTPDIQMPYCFCWANENWTRRWDGNENEILLGQNYSAQDAKDFIQYLIPFFKDPRYIKVEGRPMLYVYRPSSIPDSHEYLDIWEKECAKAGINRPYVVAVLTRGATNPHDFGMDAGVERVLHDWTGGGAPEIKDTLHQYWPINGHVLSYDDVANFYMGQKEEKNFTYFRSTVPIWDNTARYGSEAYLLHGSTPQRFQEWMESTIAYTQSTLPSDRRFVLVNAWNEWAEGAHLEPDTRYGYSYLNSVGRALSGIPYSKELNPSISIPAGTKLHLSFPEFLLKRLQSDQDIKQRFINCLARSSIFKTCTVSINTPEFIEDLPATVMSDSENADFVLEFRQIACFDSSLVEKMLQTACASGSVVIANSYDGNPNLIEVTENGSVTSHDANFSPLLLFPKTVLRNGYKNFRMRTDARCIEVYASQQTISNKPTVTTIIRYHKSADISELKNALCCLYAMSDCVVVPLIAAQDLSNLQIEELKNTLKDFSWAKGCEPQVHLYQSKNGRGDLRSKMLNESLKQVTTRYASFLDFDDLLFPYAYSWLINRLEKTGKAVSFGRVYSASFDSVSGLIKKRTRVYEYGYSYEEFLCLNHAPLHSFMLDMERINLSKLVYFEDQRYMEDYLLTLQLFTKDNGDWESLKENFYIGDYIHSIDRAHTLAFSNEQERQTLLSSPEYVICEQRICDMRETIKSRKGDVTNSQES